MVVDMAILADLSLLQKKIYPGHFEVIFACSFMLD